MKMTLRKLFRQDFKDHKGRPGMVGGSQPGSAGGNVSGTAEQRIRSDGGSTLASLTKQRMREDYDLSMEQTNVAQMIVSKIRRGEGGNPSDVAIDIFEDQNYYGSKPDTIATRETIIDMLRQEGIKFDEKKLEKYELAQEDEYE